MEFPLYTTGPNKAPCLPLDQPSGDREWIAVTNSDHWGWDKGRPSLKSKGSPHPPPPSHLFQQNRDFDSKEGEKRQAM